MGYDQIAVLITDFPGTAVQQLKAAAAELASRGGGTLVVPPGNYELDSSELATPIEIASNVTVEGNGSTFEITGMATPTAVFRSIDTSDVEIRNLRCIGNKQATGYVDGCFFFYRQSFAASRSNSGIRIRGLYLENFKAVHWLYLDNLNESYPLKNILIENIVAKSRTENYISTEITYNASVICVQGGDYNSIDQAYVDNVVIRQVDFDCFHMKTGLILYHSIRNAKLDNVIVRNAGFDPVFPNDAGCYAIQIYDKWGNGRGVDLSCFEVSSRSCGVYVAGFRDVVISGFEASGQTDTETSTLPKGGIVFNGTRDYTLRDGRIHNCVNGLQLVGPSTPSLTNALIDKVEVYENVINPLRISPFQNIPMQRVILRDSRFVGTNRGADVRVSSDEALRLDELAVTHCHFQATAAFSSGSYGFDAYALNGQHASAHWHFDRCTFIGNSVGVRIRQMSGRLTLKSCQAIGSGEAQSVQLSNSTDIELADIEAITGSGGVAYNLSSAMGVVSRTVRGSGTNIVLGLGASKPAHSGLKGQFVAAIDYLPAPGGDGQTQVIGWRCQGGSVWRPVVEMVNAA